MVENSSLHPHLVREKDQKLGLEKFLQMSEYERSKGKSVCRIQLGHRHVNLMGAMNGGVIYAATDMLSYDALLSILPHDKAGVTVDMQTSLLRGGKIGETIDMEAVVIKLGRTLAFIEVKSLIEGKLVAITKITKAILDI